MEYRRSMSRSAERTRMAKFRFLNDTIQSGETGGLMNRGSTSRRSLPLISRTDRQEEIDLSVPGTPVSSRYVMALREKNSNTAITNTNANIKTDDAATAQTKTSVTTYTDDGADATANPFTVFLNSMNKLKAGKLNESDSKDILGLLIKMETVATERDDENRPASYGYSMVGTYNGGSNLRIYPSVQRSYVRRLSLQTNADQPQQQIQQNQLPLPPQDDYYNSGYQQHNDDYGNFVNQKKCHELNGNMHFASTNTQSYTRDHGNVNSLAMQTSSPSKTTTTAVDAFRQCEKESRFKAIRERFERSESRN